MLFISVIAVGLQAHLNVDFHGRFTPSSLCFIKFLIKLSHRIILPRLNKDLRSWLTLVYCKY